MSLFHLALPIAAFALTASAQPQRIDAQPQRIDIQLSDFKFAPKTITLTHDQPYVLHLSSRGGHSFAAKAFFAAATVPAADRAKIKDGLVELKGGESVDIHLTAPAAGSYEAHCSHFMHSKLGMTGKIVVR